MKTRVAASALILILALSACVRQDTTSSSGDSPDHSQPQGITLLEEGVWPDNPYTQGLPVPPGTVAWASLDSQHENCSVSVTDLDEEAYRDYMEALDQAGFSVVDGVSEEIQGQDYVSIGTLLSDGTRWLSISYIPGHLTIYISFDP